LITGAYHYSSTHMHASRLSNPASSGQKITKPHPKDSNTH
jgi:hypothetical protein